MDGLIVLYRWADNYILKTWHTVTDGSLVEGAQGLKKTHSNKHISVRLGTQYWTGQLYGQNQKSGWFKNQDRTDKWVYTAIPCIGAWHNVTILMKGLDWCDCITIIISSSSTAARLVSKDDKHIHDFLRFCSPQHRPGTVRSLFTWL